MTLRRRTIIASAAALALPRAIAFAQSDKVYRVGLVSGSGPGAGLFGPCTCSGFCEPRLCRRQEHRVRSPRRPGQGRPFARIRRRPGGQSCRSDHDRKLSGRGCRQTGIGRYPGRCHPRRRSGRDRSGREPWRTPAATSPAYPRSPASSRPNAWRSLRRRCRRSTIIAVLYNADDLAMTLRYQAAETEAKRLDITVVPLGVREPDDFEIAFSEMTEKPTRRDPDGHRQSDPSQS